MNGSSGGEQTQLPTADPAPQQRQIDRPHANRESRPDAHPVPAEPEPEERRRAEAADPVADSRDDHRHARVLKSAQHAGGNRLTAVHLKDIAPSGENADEDGWADLGHGTVDWKALKAALAGTKVRYFVMEHDNPKDAERFASRSIATARTL